MNIITKLVQSVVKRSGSLISQENKPSNLSVDESKKRLSYRLRQNRNYLYDIDQATLRYAIQSAEDPTLPNRTMLYDLYKEALRDFHLRSAFRTAENKVIGQAWAIVNDAGEINKDLTKLMQAQWFEDCCRYALQEESWGHSLIEFGVFVSNYKGQLVLQDVKLFPRKHVRPETGEILIQEGDTKGLYYREAPWNTYLVECGRSDNLGLLEIACKYSIYKKYGIANWARSAEKYGDPLLVIRSASDDDAENAEKEKMAANFGNNGFVIMDEEDQIELLERANSTGYQIFKDFLAYVDAENSKGVNGQTGTTDNQAWAGTAQVHDDTMDDYTEERSRSLTFWVNNVLIPKLIEVESGGTAYASLKGHMFTPLRFLQELKTPQQKAQELASQKVITETI